MKIIQRSKTMNRQILNKEFILAIILSCLVIFRGYAQNKEHIDSLATSLPRTTYIAADISLGGTKILNQFLSPLPYGGMAQGLNILIEAPITKHKPLALRLASSLNYSPTLNPARNARLLQVRLVGQAETLYRFALPSNLGFSIGGGLRVLSGYNTLPANVNNQQTADLKIDLLASGQLSYLLPWRAFPTTFRLYGNAGLLGLAHQLGYNQSYFEMYYAGGGFLKTLHATHWGNSLFASLLFSIDLPIVNFCTLRVGYRLEGDRMTLEGRTSSNFLQGAFLGLSFETLWFMGRKAVLSKEHRPALFPAF